MCVDLSDHVQKAKEIHAALVCTGAALPRCCISVSLKKESLLSKVLQWD